MDIQYGDLYSKIGTLRYTIRNFEEIKQEQDNYIQEIRELIKTRYSFKHYDIINLDYKINQTQEQLNALEKEIEDLRCEIDPIITDKLNRIIARYC